MFLCWGIFYPCPFFFFSSLGFQNTLVHDASIGKYLSLIQLRMKLDACFIGPVTGKKSTYICIKSVVASRNPAGIDSGPLLMVLDHQKANAKQRRLVMQRAWRKLSNMAAQASTDINWSSTRLWGFFVPFRSLSLSLSLSLSSFQGGKKKKEKGV